MADRPAAARLGATGGSLARARLVLAAGIAAEALVGAALVADWLLPAVALHLVTCLGLLLAQRRVDPAAGWPGAVLRLLVGLLPALGPLAAAGALAALLLGPPRALLRRASGLSDDPLDARLQAVADTAALPDGLLLESLGEVLRWGNAAQKARAIDLAADPGRPGGEALLRLALADADSAVRARAELRRPAVERRLMAGVEALRGAMRGQRGAAVLAAQRALARQLDRAAFSGLLEPPRADACRAEAAGLWQALIEALPEDAEAEAALGRDLLALGDLRAARLALEAALLRDGAQTPRVPEPPPALGWLADCLFRQRDFAALEALVQRWRPVLEAEAASGGPRAAAWRLWLAGTAR